MSKRKVLILAAAALLILTIPIPLTVDTEQGIREYVSLTYKLVRIDGEKASSEAGESYRLYLFPRNFSSTPDLLMDAGIEVGRSGEEPFGTGKQDSGNGGTVPTEPGKPGEDTDMSTGETINKNRYSDKVIWVNLAEGGENIMNGLSGENSDLKTGDDSKHTVVQISSPEALERFMSAVSGQFYMGSEDGSAEDTLYCEAKKWDAGFFEEKTLLMTYVPRISSSVYFSASSVVRKGSKLCCFMDIHIPEYTLQDISGKLFILEIDKESIKGLDECSFYSGIVKKN